MEDARTHRPLRLVRYDDDESGTVRILGNAGSRVHESDDNASKHCISHVHLWLVPLTAGVPICRLSSISSPRRQIDNSQSRHWRHRRALSIV